MSLINDALRRAKQAQQPATPPPTPDTQFRPIEPSVPPARHGFGPLFPVLLGLTVLLSLLLFWELSHPNASSTNGDTGTQMTVSARTLPPAEQPSPAVEPPAAAPTMATSPNTSSPSKGLSQSARVVATPDHSSAAGGALASAPTNSAAVLAQTDTNRATATVPAPPPLKLQGIVFSPRRPSALINGRVFFVGERVREYRVVAIRQEDVLLVGAGRTNLLSLDP